MKDAIDKRNERERIARSIVKRRNIVYISQEELDRKKKEEMEEQNKKQKELAEQLVKQFKDDEKKKQAMEIERLLAEQEMLKRQLETGMDATGKRPMDDVTQERVEAILSEKSQKLQNIITSSFMEAGQEDEPVEVSIQEENPADGSPAAEIHKEDAVPVQEADMGGGAQEAETDIEEESLRNE